MQLKCVLAKAHLLTFIEGKVMPDHLHGQIRAGVSAEKLTELCTSVIELFLWWRDIDGVFAETSTGFARIAFVPAVRDGLHQLLKLPGRECYVCLHQIIAASCSGSA